MTMTISGIIGDFTDTRSKVFGVIINIRAGTRRVKGMRD